MSGQLAVSKSPYPISEIFPKEAYQKAGKLMALHFLIAFKRPEATMISWLDQNPTCLNFSDLKYLKLTPLAVCVLMQNHQMAAKLLERGADPKIGDHHRWTCFHHAAVIGDDQMLALLMQNVNEAAAKKLLNDEKGSYEDLRELLNNKVASPEEEVCLYREGDAVTPCTGAKFADLTSAQYCKSVIVTGPELIRKWMKPAEEIKPNPMTSFFEERFVHCFQSPPRLSLGVDRALPPHGMDIFAEQAFNALQGIAIYGGVFENEPTDKEYLLKNVNGKKIRNLAGIINDGFPNCICRTMQFRGFSYTFLIATRNIKQGEKLFWNYGVGHSIKFDTPHFEFNTVELEHFLNTNSPVRVFESLQSVRSRKEGESINEVQKYLTEINQLEYCLETPSLWLYLLAKNRINALDEIHYLLKEKSWLFVAMELSVELLENRTNFAFACHLIGQFLQDNQQKHDLVKAVQEQLLEWSETYPAGLIYSYIDVFVNSLNSPISSINDWKSFQINFDFYVKFMEALYYFGSDVKTIKHDEFIPKIIENYNKITPNMKKRGLQQLIQAAQSLNDTSRRAILVKIIADLTRQ